MVTQAFTLLSKYVASDPNKTPARGEGARRVSEPSPLVPFQAERRLEIHDRDASPDFLLPESTHRSGGNGLVEASIPKRMKRTRETDPFPLVSPLKTLSRDERTVVVFCPVGELFRFWRNFENLLEVFTQIKEVKMTSPTRMRWSAVAPVGADIEWETEIVDECLNRFIVWRSVQGSELRQDGSVHFRSMTDGQRTHLTVSLRYRTSGTALSALLARVFGTDVGCELERDLKRFQERLSPGDGIPRNPANHLPIRFFSGSPLTDK